MLTSWRPHKELNVFSIIQLFPFLAYFTSVCYFYINNWEFQFSALNVLLSSYLIAVTASFKGDDMTKVQSNWEQSQWRSSHLRHYHAPAPPEKGPSRNSLLQCTKMSVKSKDLKNTIHQLRLTYLKSNVEKTDLNKRKVVTPFVTKVEIIKTRTRKRSKSTDSTLGKERNTDKSVVSFMGDETQDVDDDCYAQNAPFCQIVDTGEAELDDGSIEGKSDLPADIIGMKIDEDKKATDLYLPEIPDEERENLDYLIRCLNRRIRSPVQKYRRPISSIRPIATYAKPTKGEIDLSIKGPVLLPPVSKAVKLAATQTKDKQTLLDEELPKPKLSHFEGKQNERNEPAISSDSHNAVETDRNTKTTRRVTWSGYGREPKGPHNQNNRLCHSCIQQHSSCSDTKITRERAKTAVCRDNGKQRKSCNHLPQLLRHSPTKLHAKNATKRGYNVKQLRPVDARNGIKYCQEIQVNLDGLKSYDYGSPVPPPSLSNSDDEDNAGW